MHANMTGATPEVPADEGTLTTDAVRHRYAEFPYVAEFDDDKGWEAEAADFDRWLATELQKARAEGEAETMQRAVTETIEMRAKLAAVEARHVPRQANWSSDPNYKVCSCNSMWPCGTIAAIRSQEPPTVPERMGDGLLSLACGTVWAASTAAWHAEHLPACAICLGNFGHEPPAGEQA